MPPDQIILTNARLVLPDAVLPATLVARDGHIAAIETGTSRLPGALDCAGDWLIPGLIDLHTDNLERQCQPRAGVRWPAVSAYLAHDAHCAAAAITTVLDALCVGDLGYEPGRIQTLRDGVGTTAALSRAGLLKADHALHLRCELAAADMRSLLAEIPAAAATRLISVMDHTPGFGQYADLDRFRALRRADPMTELEIEALIARLHAGRARNLPANRAHVLAHAAAHDLAVASHDDATEAEIRENAEAGIGIAEFPVTLAAAAAARAHGMQIIAGSPNLVRGFSHYGNVAVAELLAAGLVDALASDYVPASLLEAALPPGLDPDQMPARIALVTAAPARIARYADRGAIAPGLRADLAQIHFPPGTSLPPVVRAVWRQGVRIA